MGVTTVTAARIYAGQSRGVDGESFDLAMDTFPNVALSRTYGADAQISDSAPTATALVAGVKTNNGVIGVTATVTPGRCDGPDAHRARSIFEMAEEAGLATGIVSTARITHATPASAYAHTPHRNWEADANMPADSNCIDIARQLVAWPAGDGFEIAMGGGRERFLPTTLPDPENADRTGVRNDGRDLTAEWRARSSAHVFVWNSAQLAAAAPDAHILGLFSIDHMAYEAERNRANEPSLAEMTAAAIQRLGREPNGYVLLIEGGRIDHAHHDGRARHALNETAAYDEAIRAALALTSRDDTLIVATADHSHTFTISGYAARGNPILGLSADENGVARAGDGLPYTTLGYMNGPGAVASGAPRQDLSNVDTTTFDYRQQALTPMPAETHGGEDVAIYAWGPGDDAVRGTMEQNAVFHVMARALGFTWR
jgi:alkaline phosphatase